MEDTLIKGKLKGSTLIELLTVAVIIIMVVSLFIPSYSKAKDSAIEAQAMRNLTNMANALNLFYLEKKYYPRDVQPNVAAPGLCPNYLGEWPLASDNQYNSSYDYEAWSMSGGNYWIGITWYGKNARRDSSMSTIMNQGSAFVIKKLGDDYYIEVDRNAKIGP
jgi:type II secretory pathway pseudopilin PulG